MENNIFEQASRDKVRFDSGKGSLTTEDLWDLSLNSLDTLAKGVNKQLKAESEESFINPKSTSNKSLELKLEILKHVIAVRMAERDAAKDKAEKAQKIATLKELLKDKQLEQMKGMSTEDIEKQLAALQD